MVGMGERRESASRAKNLPGGAGVDGRRDFRIHEEASCGNAMSYLAPIWWGLWCVSLGVVVWTVVQVLQMPI